MFFKKHLMRLYRNLQIKEHRLSYLFFEITRRCNLQCIHCGSDCSSAVIPELTTDSWIAIARFVRENFGLGVAIVITGGEPLMHHDLEKIGSEIARLGLRWGMVTNGFALTKERMHSLLDSGLSSITVSLDGISPTHNFLRNSPKSHDRVLRALEIIARSNIELADVVTCVFPQNLTELPQIADTLLELKIPAWRLFRIFPLGRAKKNPLLTLSYDQTMQMLYWIRDERAIYRKKGLNINYSCEGYMPPRLDKAVRDFPYICRAGINIASILSDGTITGCSNNRSRFYEGNILSDNLYYIWENGFKKFRERDFAKEGTCGKCKDYQDCLGNSIHLWDNGETEPAFCYFNRL